MMAFTHVVLGVGAALILARHETAWSAPQVAYLVAGSVIGSLLPDIDHPKSWIGRRLWMISVPLSARVGHRGVTHSLVAWLGLSLVAVLVSWYVAHPWFGASLPWISDSMRYDAIPLIASGLLLGYALHLLADFFSNSGIPLFWPIKRRVASPVTIKTGGILERGLALGVLVGTGLEQFDWSIAKSMQYFPLWRGW